MQKGNAQEKEELTSDLHLKLSEKYMAYKELADRCFLAKDQVDKGEKRIFYIKPNSPFLEEPRVQNQFRNDFVRQIGQAPSPEPLTYLADDLHKAFNELTSDRSDPTKVKDELCRFFKRRQYRLQHRRYKMLLRWAHHCKTSEMIDQTAIKFNPAMSKLQFELENCVKRHNRLEGIDHFATWERPAQKEGSSYADTEYRPPISALRADDIDVFYRIATYEERSTRNAEKFIQRTKWLHLTQRFEIYKASINYYQDMRRESIRQQENEVEQIDARGKDLIELKKLKEGPKELEQIKTSKNVEKQKKKLLNARDEIMATAKYNYEFPAMVFWNEVDLKIRLGALAKSYGIKGDMDKDSGHNFSYAVIRDFPKIFLDQTILNQFAIYDALPSLINPKTLGAQDIKKVLRINQKKYGRSSAGNTLLEKIEIEKNSAEMGVEFLNSVENSLFGQYNAGQLDNFPTVRVKLCNDWIDLVCFKAELDNENMYQAALLSGEKNQIDDCLANFMEILNVNDLQSVNLILESIAQIHYDKVKYGSIRTDFLNFDPNDVDTFFSEDQKQFLSIFKGSLKARADWDRSKKTEELSASSLHEIPSHLLLATYLLQCLAARQEKTKLLYTLNCFRSIQRRLVIEMREMGTRDKVLGDALYVKPKDRSMVVDSGVSEEESTADESGVAKIDEEPAEAEDIDILRDSLIEINKYKFGDKTQNFLNSTCPIVPKFHATFGMPIEKQEISKDIEMGQKNTDGRRAESRKFLGRIDKIYKNEDVNVNLVQDDYGVHVLYDASFADMRSMELEILKTCSFYINKAEPLLDNDMRNCYPAVDRLRILEDVMKYENEFQEAKLELVQLMMECYEHTADVLEQQRLIQVVVDEMAKRPRLNLAASHFKDSYKAEIDCVKEKTQLIRDVMRTIMKDEYKVNNSTREYIEKSFRLLYESMQSKFTYVDPEDREKEINAREIYQTGAGGDRDAKNDKLLDAEIEKGRKEVITQEVIRERIAKANENASKLKSNTFGDAKSFAMEIGLPEADLEAILKDHHERDHLVRVSVHENASFIKVAEGYPHYISKQAGSSKNFFKFHENGQTIDIMDFYEGLHVMPRVFAALDRCVKQINETHKPDNGLTSSALELMTYRELIKQLDNVKSQSNLVEDKAEGLLHIEDDSIVGNPDYMLWLTKELASTKRDPKKAQNPFHIAKLDIDSINLYNFQEYQGYIDPEKAQVHLMKPAEKEAYEKKINKQKFSGFYANVGSRSKYELNFPSLLHLTCNGYEMSRLRSILINCIEQASQLEPVYYSQVKLMAKEGRVKFKDPFNFQNYVTAGENFVNFVEDGPADDLEMGCLSVNEFDPKLRSCVNFSDAECFKSLILPVGLEEFRAVVAYELMNLQSLIIGVQTNQMLIDNSQRKLAELQFLENWFTVANPVFNLNDQFQSRASMSDQNIRKIPSAQRSSINSKLQSNVGECYYNIIKKKGGAKEACEKTFKAVKQSTQTLKDMKIEAVQHQLRMCKLILCNDYIQDVLGRLYCDAIKLQILQETDSLRKRAYLLPRDSIFFEMFPSKYGEHASAWYNEDAIYENGLPDKSQMDFVNKADNRIQNFWRLPMNREICELQIDIDAFKRHNMPNNMQFNLGSPADKILPEFINDEPFKKMLKRLPQFQMADTRDFEGVLKAKGRIIDFQQAYDYTQGAQRAVHFLSYFKSIGNIFDLEFFTNKLGSISHTMCNVEKNVMSGLPFWEEGDEGLMESDEEEEEQQQQQQEQKEAVKKGRQSQKEVNQFEEEGHKPLKNVLAGQVAEKIAKQKKEKLQLIQDLESIKEVFIDFEEIMQKQEMGGSLQRATIFLNEQHSIRFYSVMNILYQMQDNYFKEKKGAKEIAFINEAILALSHQQDLKVTFHNGFHVNYALTAKQRVPIDSSVYHQDYDNFFRASQPIVDESALDPPVFNLVQGVYLNQSINLTTFKKIIPYMGVRFPRDYAYLDHSLTNLSQKLRKYLMQNINANEHTLQQFVFASTRQNEKDYQSNPSVYASILNEKKNFLKTTIRARQSRRIMMMFMSGAMLPLDVTEFQKLYQDYQSDMMMRISQKLDFIQKNRHAQAEKDMAAVRRKPISEQDQMALIKEIRQARDSTVLKQYDQAISEIETVGQEIHKFMISTAFASFERESAALAKTFEMSNFKVQAFVHPAQQFASTFHQHIDNRNHLDIINKVGAIQKMLTQIKNRCLEIETLTSGKGIVISQKDLNECLEDCCRQLIKFGEIEMRTRCEHLYNQLFQYESLIYTKDMQLLNMESKLKQAKLEMNKIINTKVFSRGNNLVYELDLTTRQLRLIKDNIFLLEKNLTDKIKLCYETELDTTKVNLSKQTKGLQDYQEKVKEDITAEVRKHVNQIDGVMKKMAQRYKDLTIPTNKQMKFDEYVSKQPAHVRANLQIEDVVLSKDGNSVQMKGAMDPHVLQELEELKDKEEEARQEILRLQDVIRMIRSHFSMKSILQKERHQFQIDNLKQQLSSNTTLWEQLAESEKREKILKQEVERAQQEIATQEKIIERLKDDIKREGVEKQKLLQFKNTKSKRLNELESKAREFEVLSSVNLSKILGLLESKEKRITELQRSEDNNQDFVAAITRINQQELDKVRNKNKEESHFKMQAMTKLETLRQELQMIQGNDQVSVNFWKEQCQSLFEISRNLKEDNERLVNAISEKPHPMDQFTNNSDLLAYLNQQQQARDAQDQMMRLSEQKVRKTEEKRRDFEKVAFGMESDLKNAMLGNSSKRSRQTMSLKVKRQVNTIQQPNHANLMAMADELRNSKNSAIQQYEQPSSLNSRFGMPKLNLQGHAIATDPSVQGINQGPPRLLGQHASPFGKMQQNPAVGAGNVFSTLQGTEHSFMSYANASPAPTGKDTLADLMQPSLNESTRMTGSHIQASGSRKAGFGDPLAQPQYSVEAPIIARPIQPGNFIVPKTHRALAESIGADGTSTAGGATLQLAAGGTGMSYAIGQNTFQGGGLVNSSSKQAVGQTGKPDIQINQNAINKR